MATTVPCREADPLPPGVVSISGKVAVKVEGYHALALSVPMKTASR